MRCKKCRQYTMDIKCPRCGAPTVKPIPPRYSPIDKYGDYRRRLKLDGMKGVREL